MLNRVSSGSEGEELEVRPKQNGERTQPRHAVKQLTLAACVHMRKAKPEKNKSNDNFLEENSLLTLVHNKTHKQVLDNHHIHRYAEGIACNIEHIIEDGYTKLQN